MNIVISVANRVATPPSDAVIVCGNSDYTLTFEFDAEWSAETTKIARFVWFARNKVYSEEVPFEGNTVSAPILSNTNAVHVGVYTGNLRTTTPAKIVCEPSILCYGQDSNVDHSDIALIKGQIAKLVDSLRDISVDPTEIRNIISDYMAKNPPKITEADPTVPAWAKASTKPKYTAAEVGAQPVGDYLTRVPDGYATEEFVRRSIAEVTGSSATIGTVNLLAANWVGSGNLYSQVVTIAGVTANSQVDLTPSVEQLVVFYEKDLTFVTENDGGAVTVYAIGQKPENDYTIQVTITEVIV